MFNFFKKREARLDDELQKRTQRIIDNTVAQKVDELVEKERIRIRYNVTRECAQIIENQDKLIAALKAQLENKENIIRKQDALIAVYQATHQK